MKRIVLFCGLLLAMGLLSGCSSDEVNKPDSEILQPGDSVLVYAVGDKEITALYEPMAYQDMPEWIQTMVDGKGKFYILWLYVYQGKKDNEKIYFTCSETDNTYGTAFNEEGEIIPLNTDYLTFFSEVKDWKLIYYYDYKTNTETK